MNRKTVIFYFSQSGNSLFVAKKLAEGIENATLVSIPEAIRKNSYSYLNYQRVGIILPLYYMSMPVMAWEFISKLEITKDSYLFSIVTRASSKGRIFYEINKLLKKNEVSLSFASYLTFPDSYIRWNEAPSEEKIFKQNENAKKSLESLTNKILCGENFVEKEGGLYKLVSLIVYNVWKSRLRAINKSFKVNNLCAQCGICEKTCPSRNIKLENGRPKWLDRCQDCMACVQHCPKKAIYFNSRTINKRRYINPNIKLDELI